MADGTSIVWRSGIGGADETKRSLQSIGDVGVDAFNRTGVAADGASRKLADADVKTRRLAESFQAAVRAQAAQSQFNSLVAPGLTNTPKSAAESAAAFEELGKTAALSTLQVQELGAAGRHTFDALVSGANPLTVVAQHALGVGNALGSGPQGVGGSVKALFGIVGTWAPLIAGTGVIGAFALAGIAYAKSMGEAEAATTGFGRTSGATAAQVLAIAEAARAAGEGSVKSALSVETALLQTGKVSEAGLKPATDATLAFAKATGQDAAAAGKALAGVFSEPATEAGKLNEKLGFLDQTTLNYIRTLDQQGDRTQAQIVLAEALKRSMDESAKHLDGVGAAWKRFGDVVDGVSQKMGRAFLQAVGFETRERDQQIKALQGRLANHQGPGVDLRTGEVITDTQAQTAAKLRQLLADQKAASSEQGKSAGNVAAQEAADRHAAASPKDADRERLRNLKVAIGRDFEAGNTTGAKRDEDIKSIDKQIAALDKSKDHHDRHAESLAREALSLEANAAGARAAAEAYLKSSALGADADARRKATTDATRKGADVEAQVRRQSNLDDAESAEAGAKAAAALHDQTKARRGLDAQVTAGSITQAAAQRQMEDEAAIRPYLISLARAQKNQEVENIEALTNAIARLRSERAADHKVADEAAAGQRAISSRQAVEEIAYQARLAQLRPNDPSREALIRSHGQLGALQAGRPDVAAAGQQAVDTDLATREAEHSKYVTETTRGMERQRQIQEAQLTLAGVSAGQRALFMADLAKRQELEDHNVTATSEEGQNILAQVRGQELLNQQIARAQAAYDEVDRFADSLIDSTSQLFENMDQGWESFQNFGLSAIKMVEQELLKLALLNPLKNALNGDSALPTLSSVGGLGGIVSRLLGGGRTALSIDPTPRSILASGFPSDLAQLVPKFATGTDNAPAGWRIAGEHGPELEYDRYSGAHIMDAQRTRALMMAPPPPSLPIAAGSGGNVIINDMRRGGAPVPAVRKDSQGNTHIDLRDQFDRAATSWVKGGGFERAAKLTPSRAVAAV